MCFGSWDKSRGVHVVETEGRCGAGLWNNRGEWPDKEGVWYWTGTIEGRVTGCHGTVY